jgi:hypothetical protein
VVREVEDGEVIPLCDAQGRQAGTITTLGCDFGDSCHLLDLGGVRVLNTNDCSFDGALGFAAVRPKLVRTPGPLICWCRSFPMQTGWAIQMRESFARTLLSTNLNFCNAKSM